MDGEIGNVQIAWFGQGGESCDGGRDDERLFDLFIGTSSIHGMGFGMERQMNTSFYTGQLMVEMNDVTLKAMGLGEMIGRRPAGLDGVWRHEEEEEEEIATEKMDANVMPIVMTLHRRPEDQGMINVDVQVKGIGMTYIDCFVDRLLTYCYCDACLFQAFVRHNKHQQPQQRNPVQVMECNPMHYFLIDGVNCQLDRECFLIIPVCLGSQNSLFIKSNDVSTLKINATDPYPEERFGYRFQVNSKAIAITTRLSKIIVFILTEAQAGRTQRVKIQKHSFLFFPSSKNETES